MRAPAALLITVLVSACFGHSERPEPPAPPPWFEFGAPVTLPPPVGDPFGSEPSILAARDGSLYIVSVLGSVPPLTAGDPAGFVEDRRGDGVWKSTDQGATWTYLGKADYPYGGGDADIDEDDAGTLYVPGQWRAAAVPPTDLPPNVDGTIPRPYVAGESMAVSFDGGTTWEKFPLASDSYYTDRQWTATYGRGTAWLVFNQLAQGLMVTKSTDSGKSWSSFRFVQGTGNPTDGPNGIPGDPIVDPKDGRLYLPYGPGIGGGSDEHRIFVSNDGGATFTARVVHKAPSNHQAGAIFGSLDLDTEGNLYYVWAESTYYEWAGEKSKEKGMTVFLSTSDDRGESWSDPLPVSRENETAVFPWITVGTPGRIAIAYYGAEGHFLSDEAPAESLWHPIAALAHSALNNTFEFGFARLQSEPNHRGPLCTGGTGCVAGTRNLGDFFEIDTTPSGDVVAVWVDDTKPERTNVFARQTLGSLRAV